MQPADDTSRRRSRVKKRVNSIWYIICGFVLLLTITFFFFLQYPVNDREQETGVETLRKSKIYSAENTVNPKSTVTPDEKNRQAGLPVIADAPSKTTDSGTQDVPESNNQTTEPLAKISADGLTQANDAPGSPVREKYSDLVDELNGFFRHLDQQEYMKTFQLQEPAKEHFGKLMQKLVDNPPVITRETDDLFTLLKNTAHFFRILGKNNIFILKGILDREKGSLEEVLRTVWELTSYPGVLKNEYGVELHPQTLYDYGSFFLNTMGGRLYLFRRDARIRLIISYYAIMAINRAKAEGYDRVGLNLMPSVDALIDEVENNGMRLKYREVYLDSLYDLKEKFDH